jgi:hypothetical protein
MSLYSVDLGKPISIEDFNLQNIQSDEIKDIELKSKFEIIIECKNEKEQKKIYDEFTERKLSCRLIIL